MSGTSSIPGEQCNTSSSGPHISCSTTSNLDCCSEGTGYLNLKTKKVEHSKYKMVCDY